MSSSVKARVLIVEDEPAIAQLLRINVESAGCVVTLARDGHEADQCMAQQTPDLILLDWMLPGFSGVTLARRWRAQDKTRHTPIIMLTGKADELDKVEGLDAGADDYLTKPFSTQELLARIRAILRRRAPANHEAQEGMLKVGPLRLNPITHRVHWNQDTLRLGPTEFKVLHCLMRSPDRVHSRAQLLDKVWGTQVFIEERTVDVHIKRLRAAMGPAGDMIETVRGAGYRLLAKQTTATAPSS